MADRPQNYCRDCGYQWSPRGHDRAARCPGCRGTNVGAVLSLDDAEPAPPPPGGTSALPMLVAAGILGLGVLTAGGLAVYLLRDNPKPQPEVAAAKATTPAPNPTPTPAPAPPVVPKQPDPPAPAPVVTPKKNAPPAPAPVEPEPPAPTPTPVPMPPAPAPKTPDPAPKTPMPPERVPSPFPPPAGSWESAWEKAGDVRIRVAGVALSKVPLEARKKKFLSPEQYFVVWVEVENTSKAAHAYRRWQPVTTGECTLRYASGGAVGYAIYPTDAGREWFTEFTQPLPPGRPPVLESLVFSRPDTAYEGPLTLTLDATRAGGAGRVEITIPRAVWTRR